METDYLTQWVEAAPVTDCTAMTIAMFLFDNIVTRFGFPKILMSNQGIPFINCTISTMTKKIKIHHKKSTPYHPQENGMVEEFKKVL